MVERGRLFVREKLVSVVLRLAGSRLTVEAHNLEAPGSSFLWSVNGGLQWRTHRGRDKRARTTIRYTWTWNSSPGKPRRQGSAVERLCAGRGVVDTKAAVMRTCPECMGEVSPEAKRCPHCGVVQRQWKRRTLQASAMLSALLVIVPVWQLAISTTDLFKTELAVEVAASYCELDVRGRAQVVLSAVNGETDRIVAWGPAKLDSVKVRGTC